MSSCRFIERQRRHYAVRELCQALDVAPSAYYAWRQQRQRPAPAWERTVCRTFAQYAYRYGTRCLRAELQAAGYPVGRYCIRRVLRQHGLRAPQPRSFVLRTIDSGHGQRVAPNQLLGQPRPSRPVQVWVGDSTCLPKQGGGWLYLASWQDAYSRKVVGARRCPKTWSARLCGGRWPCAGLLVHADRGGQYCGRAYCKLLCDHEAVRSPSYHGDCYDKAQAESLWSCLVTQVLKGRERPVFALPDAQASIADYVDCYNYEHLHSSTSNQTPHHTHQQLLQLNALNCPA